MTNGGTAILNNGFQVKAGLTSTFNNGNATITGQIILSSSLTVSGTSALSDTTGIQVNSGGTLTFTGGTITNSGGGIQVNSSGTFNMSGGTTSTVSGQNISVAFWRLRDDFGRHADEWESVQQRRDAFDHRRHGHRPMVPS